ncbi:hypothetical protein AEST_32270 [Alishewanella aestuarii B11]|uniref:Uncharacterized protein n=1 Tax=Alishewanella aestuarii B11 TaxID=1197174 RepID=J1QEV5_9ALTE|nr:hypothetical protein AEST_32270 [Alishewanella aestuarii B11]
MPGLSADARHHSALLRLIWRRALVITPAEQRKSALGISI